MKLTDRREAEAQRAGYCLPEYANAIAEAVVKTNSLFQAQKDIVKYRSTQCPLHETCPVVIVAIAYKMEIDESNLKH